jgi:hypothetical protein
MEPSARWSAMTSRSWRAAVLFILILVLAAWRLPISSHVRGAGGATEASWSGFWYGELKGGAPYGMNLFVPSYSHTLTRFDAIVSVGPYYCTTNAVVAIKDITTGTILTSLTITTGVIQDSGPLSVQMTGGDTFAFVSTGGASGCQVFPGGVTFTAVYE